MRLHYHIGNINLRYYRYYVYYRSLGELGIGDQTRHRQLETRLSEVCLTKTIAREKSVDDYDF